jgi:hypothetical protein
VKEKKRFINLTPDVNVITLFDFIDSEAKKAAEFLPGRFL